MWLDTLNEKHYRAAYDMAMANEPYSSDLSFEQFTGMMKKREGYVVVAPDGNLVGCVSFSDYIPEVNAIIHCVVDKKYQKRWVTKKMLKTVWGYVFDTLHLPRISGFCVKGLSENAGKFLVRLGFKEEGIIRKGFKSGNELYDLMLFGMLKEECKWV